MSYGGDSPRTNGFNNILSFLFWWKSYSHSFKGFFAILLFISLWGLSPFFPEFQDTFNLLRHPHWQQRFVQEQSHHISISPSFELRNNTLVYSKTPYHAICYKFYCLDKGTNLFFISSTELQVIHQDKMVDPRSVHSRWVSLLHFT